MHHRAVERAGRAGAEILVTLCRSSSAPPRATGVLRCRRRRRRRGPLVVPEIPAADADGALVGTLGVDFCRRVLEEQGRGRFVEQTEEPSSTSQYGRRPIGFGGSVAAESAPFGHRPHHVGMIVVVILMTVVLMLMRATETEG